MAQRLIDSAEEEALAAIMEMIRTEGAVKALEYYLLAQEIKHGTSDK